MNLIAAEPNAPNWDQSRFVAESARALAEVFPPTCDQCRHDGRGPVPATMSTPCNDYCDAHADYHQRLDALAARPVCDVIHSARRVPRVFSRIS